jgi:hypothetical protein
MVGSGLKDFDPAVGSQCIPKPDSPLQVGINAGRQYAGQRVACGRVQPSLSKEAITMTHL